jgi:hypothetical protein
MAGSGSFTSHGTTIQLSGSGIQTVGGDVTLDNTGSVLVAEGGIGTNGGDVAINKCNSATFRHSGVYTDGGEILVKSYGVIEIEPGTTFISGGGNDGGNITLRSKLGIVVDSVLSTLPGTSGQLAQQGKTWAIALNQAPTLGAGDITLYVGSIDFPWSMYLPAIMNTTQ